jgi:hypothetical protein
MMGLDKDPRVVLQVLGVKVEGKPPTNVQLMTGYKKALVGALRFVTSYRRFHIRG